MTYWLMKSEPNAFSIDDLKRVKTEPWDGVRNYQVRNMMRDQMRVGDFAFFYHSNCKVPGIVGTMKIVKTGYPDYTAWDKHNEHYDPKSTPDNPRWFMVDVQFKEKFNDVIALTQLKANAALADLPIVKKGNRLSIVPINQTQWDAILAMRSTQ